MTGSTSFVVLDVYTINPGDNVDVDAAGRLGIPESNVPAFKAGSPNNVANAGYLNQPELPVRE